MSQRLRCTVEAERHLGQDSSPVPRMVEPSDIRAGRNGARAATARASLAPSLCASLSTASHDSIATGPAAMDASIVVFIAGSCVSFMLFYWTFARRGTGSRARKRVDRAHRYGMEKLSFLDGLRHEAGLRAQAVLDAAVDQVSKGSRSGATIDAEMMNRLRETRSMLQSLLPREFTSEFDHIVRLLHAPPSVRRGELDAALERLSDKVAGIAGLPGRTPARPEAGERSSILGMRDLSAAGNAR